MNRVIYPIREVPNVVVSGAYQRYTQEDVDEQRICIVSTVGAVITSVQNVDLRIIESSAYSSIQKTVVIHDLDSGQFTLLRPIDVLVESSAYHVSAFVDALNEFEYASDEVTALQSLKASIVDLYSLLKENQEHLGPIPAAQWAFLKKVVQEV